MKNEKYKAYITVGLTAFTVIAASLLTAFVLFHFSTIRIFFESMASILMPFIVGLVITYLLAPLYNFIVRNAEDSFSRWRVTAQRARRLAVALAVLVSILLSLCGIGGLVALVVPSFVSSLMGITESMQSYIDQINQWINEFFADNPIMAETFSSLLDTSSDQLVEWVSDTILPSLQGISQGISGNVGNLVGALFSGVVVVFKVAKNLILGFIVAAYLLVGKTEMLAHVKQTLYSLLPVQRANRVISHTRYVHQVFGGFIRGKLLDSLIMGILCFVGTSLLRIPYAMLISVIIGITNIIPFFGPFIGAVPCACLVLVNSPVKCVTFVIFVLAIQQFDGNILGPKILGESTGLSAFWVLFAIIVFGGVFGFVGMIIGVPVFAVICTLIEGFITGRLEDKELSSDVDDYVNLKRIHRNTNGHYSYEKMKDPTKK